MRRAVAFLAASALLCGADHAGSPAEYLGYVKFLSSPEMRGRATGSPELDRAAAFLADQFQSFGLRPLHPNNYLQDFDVTTSAKIGPQNEAGYSQGGHHKTLKFERDFVPLNLSATGKVSGQVVFAGYGITAPEYNYDDYAGIDAKDKIVLVLRHEPQELDDQSVFEGRVFTSHSQIFAKAANAKVHGARAVVILNDREAHKGDADELPKFGTTAGPANAGLAIVQIKAEIASKWIESAGKSLGDLQTQIDSDLKPRSFSLPPSLTMDFRVDLEREVKTAHNVVAYLPGETDEYVIVGAHYDHLGLGGVDSLAPSQIGTVHPGADDNASGTSGVLELARWIAQEPKHKRGFLFLEFAGEELGLLGSNFYANHPELPLEKAVAMVNLDMIGRLRDNKVFVGGVGSGTTLSDLLKGAAGRHGIQTDISEKAGYGSSDHTSFTAKQVPVLFFFSGLHADYHKPSDTWDKIDSTGAIQLLELVDDVMAQLADDPARPKFVRVEPQAEPVSHTTGSAPKSGYGPDFGSIPDFTELPNGVRFADVRPGSPAAKAGFQAGDILTEFDGKKIQNLYDFTYALRAKTPGDQVLVKVLRGEATIEAKVLLTARK